MAVRLWIASDLHLEYPRQAPVLFEKEGSGEGGRRSGRERESTGEKEEEEESKRAEAKGREEKEGEKGKRKRENSKEKEKEKEEEEEEGGENSEVKVVALLGDIGNPLSINGSYAPFLASLAIRFDKVLVIAGSALSLSIYIYIFLSPFLPFSLS